MNLIFGHQYSIAQTLLPASLCPAICYCTKPLYGAPQARVASYQTPEQRGDTTFHYMDLCHLTLLSEMEGNHGTRWGIFGVATMTDVVDQCPLRALGKGFLKASILSSLSSM